MDHHPYPTAENAPAAQPLRQAQPAPEQGAATTALARHQPAPDGGSYLVRFGVLIGALRAFRALHRALNTLGARCTHFGQRLKIRCRASGLRVRVPLPARRNHGGIPSRPAPPSTLYRAPCGSHLVRFGAAVAFPAALTGCGAVEIEALAPVGVSAPAVSVPPVQVLPEKARQAEALAIIRETWGQPAVPMRLEWVEGAALNCGPTSFVNVDGACVYGTVEWESPPRVRVGWEPADRFSTTPLAHELCHLYFGDPGHLAECGTRRPGTTVLPAEQALREAGL